MAFEDLLRTVTLNFTVFALDAAQRWKDARTKAQAGTLTADEAARNLVSSSVLALDAWASLFGGVVSIVGPLVIISGPASGVPNTGPGPGGSVALASVPPGPLDWTDLVQKPGGPLTILKSHVTASITATTLNVGLINAGPVSPALYGGEVTKGGTTIATVIAHLF